MAHIFCTAVVNQTQLSKAITQTRPLTNLKQCKIVHLQIIYVLLLTVVDQRLTLPGYG